MGDNMNYTVEKDWTTAAGLRAVVIMGGLGHRCGYVGVQADHPLHGASYSEPHESLVFPEGEEVGKRGILALMCGNGEARPDCVFDVHGGLTYSGGRDTYPVESDGLWWFGYDCGHAGDAPSDEYLQEQKDRYPDMDFMWRRDWDSVHRDLEYCVDECESLARQLLTRPKVST